VGAAGVALGVAAGNEPGPFNLGVITDESYWRVAEPDKAYPWDDVTCDPLPPPGRQ